MLMNASWILDDVIFKRQVWDSLRGAQLHFPHQVLRQLLFDLNLVLQRRLTKSPVDENLKRFPEAEVVFVEGQRFLSLFLSLDLHGGWDVKSDDWTL